MSVKVTVIGHIVRNPETQNSQSGQQYTRVSVAGNEGNYDNQEAFYFDADFFGKRGQTVLGYEQGDLVCVSGHLHEYQSQSGRTYKSLRYSDIELLQRAHPENHQQGGYQQQAPQQQPYQPQSQPNNYQQQSQGYQPMATEQVDVSQMPFKSNGNQPQGPQKPQTPQQPQAPKPKQLKQAPF